MMPRTLSIGVRLFDHRLLTCITNRAIGQITSRTDPTWLSTDMFPFRGVSCVVQQFSDRDTVPGRTKQRNRMCGHTHQRLYGLFRILLLTNNISALRNSLVDKFKMGQQRLHHLILAHSTWDSQCTTAAVGYLCHRTVQVINWCADT